MQEGDPLGPLLCCLAVADTLNACSGDLVVGFLDGFYFGRSLQELLGQLPDIKARFASLGLSLNHVKCEWLE